MDNGVRPLIAGNWKMNGVSSSLDQLQHLNTLLDEAGDVDADILVCPPATLLHRAARVADGTAIMVGGQDCHQSTSGAHTGDISAQMLADAGARFVIVGHSERRVDHGESSERVREKAAAGLAAGLVPVICVGEMEADRDAGRQEDVVGGQLQASLPVLDGDGSIVIAYEPVWAIGTGKTATTDDIASMHAYIRGRLAEFLGEKGRAIRILYGGSVKPSNASDILRAPNVNGALVGGASLNAEDFFSIVVAG